MDRASRDERWTEPRGCGRIDVGGPNGTGIFRRADRNREDFEQNKPRGKHETTGVKLVARKARRNKQTDRFLTTEGGWNGCQNEGLNWKQPGASNPCGRLAKGSDRVYRFERPLGNGRFTVGSDGA